MDITVMGNGRAALTPERATLSISAGFESGDKAEALGRTTELVQRLNSTIVSMREANPSPTTWSAVLPITTGSWRPYSDKGNVPPMRYAATAPVKVKFRDFQALSWFVDAWGGIEGITIRGVEWTLTDETRQQQQADVLTAAVIDARDRATILATAAGADRVEFVELADPGLLGGQRPGDQEMVPVAASRAYAKGADYGEGVDITPEDVEITASVHARFTTA